VGQARFFDAAGGLAFAAARCQVEELLIRERSGSVERNDEHAASRSGAAHPHSALEFQLDWDVANLHGRWPTGPDNFYLLHRISILAAEVTAAGGPARVLEVAAAEALHSCRLSLRGIETFVVEPSPVMLQRARQRIAESGARVTLVRGVAETLPFPDQSFDRVLLDSAIDHLTQPELSVREMARVLASDGRLIISFVNYGGASVRLSRLLYRAGRAAGLASPHEHLFWDTPVPIEHTFECSLSVLKNLCRPYLELDQAFGVSLGWMVPGWGPLLRRLPERRALALMRQLDRLAYRRPALADVVFTAWRPRCPGAAVSAPRDGVLDGSSLTVRPTDAVYPSRARAEAEFWARSDFGGNVFALLSASDRRVNQAYTGDAERSWLDDLMARGPFRHAAVLGCDEAGYERSWIRAGTSERLDVYELSPGVIRKVRAGLGLARREARRVRFIRADLNFARLPENAYDVVWSSGCLHHISNLEHLFAQVERALRPGGLFAFRDYVGERRMQFAPQRLERINAVLAEVPERWRRFSRVEPSRPGELSPFCAVRSDEILALAERRFDVVHARVAGALFPLALAIDLAAIDREAPDLAARLDAAEREALRDGLRPCGAYAVLRKRA
jgi:SAM-dependent methyltransferase